MSVPKTAQPGIRGNAANIHPAKLAPPTLQAIPPAGHELGPGPAAELAYALHSGNTALVTALMNDLTVIRDPQQVAYIAAANLQDGRNGLYCARQGGHADAEKAYLLGLARLHQQDLITAKQYIDIVKTAAHPGPAKHQGDMRQAALASRHVLREEPQPQQPRQLQQPQQPQPRLQPRRPAVSFSAFALFALCMTTLFAAGARQLAHNGPQLEPTIDGPTPVPPLITDEFARLGIPLQPGEVGAPADQCLAQDDDGPDLSTTLGASQHLLREGPPPQPVAVGSTPASQRAQQTADVFAGKGFDGKPSLLFMLQNGQTAGVAEFMERLAGLGLNPQQVDEVLAKASIGLANAMMNGHIATVTALIHGLKHIGLSPQQIGDIVADSLCFALTEGHAAAVTAFMAGLNGLELSPEQIAEVVVAYNADGLPGLYLAMQEGHAAAVTAFLNGLEGLRLSPQDFAEIVEARPMGDGYGNGNSLSIARARGHVHAVKAYREGLARLQQHDLITGEQVTGIMAAAL
jgi:hypothetical protein